MGEDAGMSSFDDSRYAGRVVGVAVGDQDSGDLFRLSADRLDIAEHRSDVPWQSGVDQGQSLVLDQIGARPRDARYGVDPVDYLQLAPLQSRDVRARPRDARYGVDPVDYLQLAPLQSRDVRREAARLYCLSPAWGSGEAAVKAIYPLRIMRALIAGRPSLEIGCGGSFGPIPREYRDVTG